MRHIGILGGGQLGLMLAESLVPLGVQVHLYDPDPAAPAATQLANITTAPFTATQSLRDFFNLCDRVTYESENIPTAPLRAAGGAAKLVPSVEVLTICQNRVLEKQFLRDQGLPHVAFAVVPEAEALPQVLQSFGVPCILKSARGGYDGKKQYRIAQPGDLAHIAPLVRQAGGSWILEEHVDIATEVSCIVARTPSGQCYTFPIFENTHQNHILDVTVVPARISQSVAERVTQLAVLAAERLGVVGLLTVECFVLRHPGRFAGQFGAQDALLRINEFAPRPHNSGHVSRKATTISQFDALARLLTDTPLTPPAPSGPGGYCMAQLLGQVWHNQGSSQLLNLGAWAQHPAVLEVFQYGKTQVRPTRKMGHVITHGPTADQAEAAARAFRQALSGG